MLVTVKLIEVKKNDGEDEDVVLDINGQRHEIGAATFHDAYPEIIREVVGRELSTEENAWTWNEGAAFDCAPVSREFPDHISEDRGGRCSCPLCNHTSDDDPQYMAWKQRQPHTPNTKIPWDEVKQPILDEAKKFPKSQVIFVKEHGAQYAIIEVPGGAGSHYRRYEGTWDKPGGKWIIESPDYAKLQGLDAVEQEKLKRPDLWLQALREASPILHKHAVSIPDNLDEHTNKAVAAKMAQYFRPFSEMSDDALFIACLWITWSWKHK